MPYIPRLLYDICEHAAQHHLSRLSNRTQRRWIRTRLITLTIAICVPSHRHIVASAQAALSPHTIRQDNLISQDAFIALPLVHILSFRICWRCCVFVTAGTAEWPCYVRHCVSVSQAIRVAHFGRCARGTLLRDFRRRSARAADLSVMNLCKRNGDFNQLHNVEFQRLFFRRPLCFLDNFGWPFLLARWIFQHDAGTCA